MTELSPEFESVMEQVRQLEVNPHKAAAISAILLSEMPAGKDDETTEVARLDRAFGWLCAAIDEIDEYAGVRVKVALDSVRKTLDGIGYDVNKEVLVNGMVVSKEAWDDPETYNKAVGGE